MDAKQIKTALKDAREAITNKDYKEALKHCKIVLSADKENYNALVFIGVAAQELDQPSQAVVAFKRAITANPTQKLAYQGLCAFYEKNKTPEHIEELLANYPLLIELYDKGNEIEKEYETASKYAQLLIDKGDVDKCVDTLAHQLKVTDDNEKQYQLHLAIINALVALSDISSHLLDQLEQSLEKCLHSYSEINFTNTIDWLQSYAELLFKKENVTKAFDEIFKMFTSHSDSVEVGEILCKAFLELAYDDFDVDLSDDQLNQLESCAENILVHSSDLKVAKLTILLLSFIRQNYEKMTECLNSGISATTAFEYSLLIKCYETLHQHVLVNSCSTKGLELCKKISNEKKAFIIEKSLTLSWLNSRLHITSKEAASEDISSLQKILEEGDKEAKVVTLLVLNYLKLGDFVSAREILNNNKSVFNSAERLGYDGMIAHVEENLDEAKLHLTESLTIDPENSNFLLELAIVYREINEYNSSMACIIKAMKLDPYNPKYMFEMGNHFKLIKETGKARRCYHKAFTQYPDSEEIGSALSDIYQDLNDTESNLNLLTFITSREESHSLKWAWLRLGLLYLKLKNPTAAIKALHLVLRVDQENSHCWEALADAYLFRGSFTSALKSYTKCLELNPGSVYCTYQMASIKQLLQQYAESAVDYEAVLEKNPDYIPALKGYGEVLIFKAREHIKQYFHGLAKDCCSRALQLIARAAHLRGDLTCLWKLLGDICTLVFDLPEEICYFSLPETLYVDKQNGEPLMKNKLEMLQMGSMFYGRAINLMPDCAGLWYDLTVNYLNCSKVKKVSQDNLEKAIYSGKKAVSLDSQNFLHWNILGVVATETKNFALAQHCFINSIICEKTNPCAWTNLGIIYLIHANKELAHLAFNDAQALDPNLSNSWIGQATIAEWIQHSDTMELFRHSVNLSNHDESALGYSNQVIHSILLQENKSSSLHKYWVENMAAVPIACDCMARYTDRHRTDPQALNMYGLLLEKENMYPLASAMFEKSLKILEQQNESNEIDIVRCNYARLLSRLELYKDAYDQYLKIKKPDFSSQCGLAEACYLSGLWQESFEAYEAAYHWFAANDAEKSEVLVAMAKAAYKQNDVEKVKSYLFQSSEIKPPSVHGLIALCAFGLLNYKSESELVPAALQALASYRKNEKLNPVITFLSESLYEIEGKLSSARNTLCKAIHTQPSNSNFWALLSLRLVATKKGSEAMYNCANITETLMRLDSVKQISWSKQMSGECLSSFCALLSGNIGPSFKNAQKAVHSNPGIVTSWCSLIAAAFASLEVGLKMCDSQWLLDTTKWTFHQIKQDGGKDKELLLWILYYRIWMLVDQSDLIQAKKHLQEVANIQKNKIYDALSLLIKAQEKLQQNSDMSFEPSKDIPDSSDDALKWQIIIKSYVANNQFAEAKKITSSWMELAAKANDDENFLKALVYHTVIVETSSNDTEMQENLKLFSDRANKLQIACKASYFFQAMSSCHQNNIRDLKMNLRSILNHDSILSWTSLSADEILRNLNKPVELV